MAGKGKIRITRRITVRRTVRVRPRPVRKSTAATFRPLLEQRPEDDRNESPAED